MLKRLHGKSKKSDFNQNNLSIVCAINYQSKIFET